MKIAPGKFEINYAKRNGGMYKRSIYQRTKVTGTRRGEELSGDVIITATDKS